MATLHVAAGGGSLSVAATYVENAVPTTSDTIVIDNTSGGTNGSAGAVSLTSANVTCNSLDASNYSGTLSCSTTRTLTVGGRGGSGSSTPVLKLGASMTWNITGTLTITLDPANGNTLTVTTNGVALKCATLNLGVNAAVGGSISFADSCNLTTTCTAINHLRTAVTVTSGTTFTATAATYALTATTGTTSLTISGATFYIGSATFSTSGVAFTYTDNASSLFRMEGSGSLTLQKSNTYLGEFRALNLTTLGLVGTFKLLTVTAGITLNVNAAAGATFSDPAGFPAGTAGHLNAIQSSLANTNATISCASQIITDYIAFTANGTGKIVGGGAGNPHNAGLHSTGGPLTGWIFPSAVTGTASLSGGGTFTASGTRKVLGVSSFSEGGTVTASGVRQVLGAGTFAEGGTIAAAGTRKVLGAATLSESWALTASGVRSTFGASILAPGPTLASAGTRATYGQSTTSLGPVISSAGVRTVLGVGTLAPGGQFTVVGYRTVNGTADLAFIVTISAAGVGVSVRRLRFTVGAPAGNWQAG